MKKFKNKKIFLFLLILFIIGFLFGLSFIFFINDMDKTILKKEIEEFILIINGGKYEYFKSLLNSFKINFMYVTIIWSVGILFIFIPIIYFIIVYKGFLLGFLISSFIMIYKIKGVIYSIVFMFPHEIINVFLIISLSILSIKYSKKMYINIKENKNINIKSIVKKYLVVYFIYIGVALISSILEIFINTFLIKLVI